MKQIWIMIQKQEKIYIDTQMDTYKNKNWTDKTKCWKYLIKMES